MLFLDTTEGMKSEFARVKGLTTQGELETALTLAAEDECDREGFVDPPLDEYEKVLAATLKAVGGSQIDEAAPDSTDDLPHSAPYLRQELARTAMEPLTQPGRLHAELRQLQQSGI